MALHRAARTALADFGFSEAAVASVEQLPQGIKNLNYRVRAGEREWVLKRHQAPGAADRLRFTQGVEQALAAAGLPVPRPFALASGETSVSTAAGVFTLHPWIDGRQISIDQRDATHARHPELVTRLGTLLGELHRLAGGLATGRPDPATLLAAPSRTVRSIRTGRPYRFRKTLRLRLHPGRTPFGTWILRHLPALYAEAKALTRPEVAALVDPADVVVAHNDLNWENLIFDDDFAVVALLDFDNAAPLPRALEVGAAAAVLVGPDPARREAFVGAYETAAGATVDRAAVTVAMRWKCARSMLWSIDAHLSGRVGDTAMVETWCEHLYACLRELPPIE